MWLIISVFIEAVNTTSSELEKIEENLVQLNNQKNAIKGT